ncbi:MAG: fibronectin type III domain-containing protein [Chloroflexota bacterium]
MLDGSTATDLNERPQRFWFTTGSQGKLTFTASTIYDGELEMTLSLPTGVTLLEGETTWRGADRKHHLQAVLRFDRPGQYRLSGTTTQVQSGFENKAEVIVRVVASAQAALHEVAAICPGGLCGRARVSDGAELQDGLLSAAPAAPAGMARVYGVTVTYPFTDTRQYPLRGVRIELWEDVSGGPDVQLGGTINTKEPTTEGRCGLNRVKNYVEGNTWYTTSGEDSGAFDFGNVEVGTGKQLYFKITYLFTDGGTGVDDSGAPQIVVRDLASAGEPIVGHESARFWATPGNSYLKFVSPPALGTAGTLADEAAHVFYDMSRMYGYMRDCVGTTTSYVTAYIDQPNIKSPTSAGGAIYFRGSNTNYLTYQLASTIVHEYGHSIMYFMRGAEYPPYDKAGYPPVTEPDTWHGNCANLTSAGGLTEGWADFLPGIYFDEPLYRWDEGLTPKDFSLNTGEFAECENSEWTFAAILWDIWTEVGNRDGASFAEIAASLESWGPDYIDEFYEGYTDDWNVCYQTWLVFNNHNVTYPTCPPPAPPSLLSASSIWQDQVHLSWTDNSSNNDDFHIERSPDGSTNWLWVGATADNWWDNSGLTCGTTYYYRVRAHRHGDWSFSSYSNVASAATAACPAPEAPTSLSATAYSSSQINLAWTDNSSDESDFHIERSPNGSSSWSEVAQVNTGTTSYTNSGLSCNTPYYYRVRAHRHSDGQYSGYSYTASATTQVCAALSPPSNLVAETMSTSRIDLTWADNSTNESEFRIERSDNGVSGWSEVAANPANDNTYSNTGLSTGTTYYYRVRAYRSSDSSYSAYSNIASATTYYTIFDAPNYLWATAVSTSQINLSWTDRTYDESDFHIERSLDGANWSQIAQVSANTTDYGNTGLNCDTRYDYRVRAHRHNDSTYSDYSPVESARTQACPDAPRAPSNLVAHAVSETRIEFTWNDNSSDESDFHIEQSHWSDHGWIEVGMISANSTWAAIDGLDCNTTDFYRIRAHRHSDGASSYSNVVYEPTWPCGWNDDFWLAYPVAPLNFQRIQGVDGATTAVDDPDLPCASGPGYLTVWFKYEATVDATLTVRTLNSSYDTVLVVWTGPAPDYLTNQACNDDYSGTTSQVSLSQVKGATYSIEVASKTANPTYKGLILEASISNAPTPALTRLLPDWKAAGMPDFTMTVYGQDFIDGISKVRWNGSNRPTIFKSSSKLETTIYTSDISSAGGGSVTVSNESGGGGISSALNLAIIEPVTFDISAGWSTAVPSVDGLILGAEWAGAQTYDITAPSYASSQLSEDPPGKASFATNPLGVLSWLRSPFSLMIPTQPLSAVILSVKNDLTHLYLAIDNPNDTTLSSSDQVLVYFDDLPLPSDGLWNTSEWCPNEVNGEGYFVLAPSQKYFYEQCSTGTYPNTEEAPGLEKAFSLAGGHIQVEIKIDLTTSALDLAPESTVGMYLRLRDGANYAAQGVWPLNGVGTDPSTFRMLTLAPAPVKVFLPMVVRQ